MIDKLLENEKYEDALKLLVSPKTEKEYYQRIICLYSLNKLNEAKVECELALEMAEKMYYDITALYVSILTDLEEDELAIKVLEEELEMPYIPYKYEVQFNASYDELLKKRMANNKVHSAFDLLSDEELTNALLSTKNDVDFTILLSQLENRNIRRFINILEDFLISNDIKQHSKSIIIELLKSQDVNRVVKVKNKDNVYEIDLSKIENVLEQHEIELILNKIEEIENNDEYNYLFYAQQVLFSYAGYIYPNLLKNININDVSCAISLYIDSLFNKEEDFEYKANIYKASLSEVNKLFDDISDSML